METREQLHQRVQRDQQLTARLRLATTRLADAEQERIWAIVAAHQAGLSIRQIAAATGLSRSRIHQLLQADEARRFHVAQSAPGPDHAANEHDAAPPPPQTHMQARVAEEVEVLRWCLDWLARLERGEQVVVNLRPDTEDATEYVRFDQARVRRVLARIAADLDLLARHTRRGRPHVPSRQRIPVCGTATAWPSRRKAATRPHGEGTAGGITQSFRSSPL